MVKTATLTKAENAWVIILEFDDGERNDYRFPTQTAARYWAARAGVELPN